jgi:gamma-glutamyltranspeptidase/glutathione hydrolase
MDPFTWRTIMMKPTFLRWVAIAALMAGGTFSVAANPPAAPPVSYGVEEDVFHPVRATQGMVASVDALATRVGVDILRQGGNAVDAAVAVGYALAVTHPQAGTWAAAAL